MKIISGGQTGVDETALQVAKVCGVPTGGFMPKGWRTEAGARPEFAELYGMIEHPEAGYPPRTKANVEIGHCTVWFGTQTSAGFKCTENACMRFRRPMIINPDVQQLVSFITANHFSVVNVAGNRKSTDIGGFAARRCELVLTRVLKEVHK